MNTTKISFNRENQEYRVRLFVDGIYQAGADYFTDDRCDAVSTAGIMEANGGISDKTSDFAVDEQNDYDNEHDMVMYDVCNDYSLEEMETDFDYEGYRTEQHEMGTVYIHKEYDEVHYLRGKKGLNGHYLTYKWWL